MSTELEPPVHKIAYEANSFCNQPCGFCFATFNTPADVAAAIHTVSPDVDTDSVLSTEEVKTFIVDPFKKMGGTILQFTGGDPFLRKDLPELVEYATDAGLLVSVDTNGLILAQDRNRAVFERVIPQLYKLGVPLDARNKKLQTQMRGHRLAYQAAQRVLAIAAEVQPTVPHFPEIKVNTVVTAMNHTYVPELAAILEPYIRKLSAEGPSLIGRWSIDAFRPMERGALHREVYAVSDEVYRSTITAARNELAVRGLIHVITGDQPKNQTTLLISPQGIGYVPTSTEKHFSPMSLRNVPLKAMVSQMNVASRAEQYTATLGGAGGGHVYRQPEWAADFISPIP